MCAVCGSAERAGAGAVGAADCGGAGQDFERRRIHHLAVRRQPAEGRDREGPPDEAARESCSTSRPGASTSGAKAEIFGLMSAGGAARARGAVRLPPRSSEALGDVRSHRRDVEGTHHPRARFRERDATKTCMVASRRGHRRRTLQERRRMNLSHSRLLRDIGARRGPPKQGRFGRDIDILLAPPSRTRLHRADRARHRLRAAARTSFLNFANLVIHDQACRLSTRSSRIGHDSS